MGSSVHISCDPGYEAAQPNAVDVVCDGSWGSGSSCVPIMCPPYAPGEHAVASDAKSHTVGETVSVHCEAGFEPGTLSLLALLAQKYKYSRPLPPCQR